MVPLASVIRMPLALLSTARLSFRKTSSWRCFSESTAIRRNVNMTRNMILAVHSAGVRQQQQAPGIVAFNGYGASGIATSVAPATVADL